MDTKANLAHSARDPRLDLFLGLANWSIFLDHIPNNMVSWITLRNYGFSGAVDVFIFISGYTAAISYGKIMLERGSIVGSTRVLRRAWQLYAAFIVLFAIYVVSIGDVATRYAAPDIIYEFNIAGLVEEPVRTVAHALLLQTKALNLDVLQLLVLLTACFPLVLWMLLRKPGLTMAGSFALYLAARQFSWNLASFPDGSWYFNPFCWQLLFVLGAWCALGGARRLHTSFRSQTVVYLGLAYLILALVMTMAGRFGAFGQMFPAWLLDAFIPIDKTKSLTVSLPAFRRRRALCGAADAEGLARVELAGIQADHHLWPAIPYGVLHRRLSLLRLPFCPGDELGDVDDADRGEPRRSRDHDPRGQLCRMVQSAGSPASTPDGPNAFAESRLGDSVRRRTDRPTILQVYARNLRKTGEKLRIGRDNDRFSPKTLSPLSYQAPPIPRIVRRSDMPVCGDRQSVFCFFILRRRRDG